MALLNNRVKFAKINKIKISTFFNRYILVLLLILCIIASQVIRKTDFNNTAILEINGNLHSSSAKFSQFMATILNPAELYFANLEQLKSQNAELKMQVEEVKTQLNNQRLIEADNLELRKLLNFVSSIKINFFTTKIIGLINSLEGNYAIIDCGEMQNIQKNNLVISQQGLVGKVFEVSKHYSKVLLINNNKFRIPVITSSLQKGILIGDASKPYIAYLPNLHSLTVDELVSTCAGELSTIPDVVVGNVLKIQNNKAFIQTAANSSINKFISVVQIADE
jgi:rod shape-determining protein MreC